ncbi:MAG: NADH-quinone oxidoreductase subunit C [Chloroflexi bacterium]|nr:NADH-quinone oxidoreductase subunit C [Chloroflexota bacterium]
MSILDWARQVRLLHPNEWEVVLTPANLTTTVEALCANPRNHFTDMFGVEMGGERQLRLLFALDSEHGWLHLVVPVTGDSPHYTSLVEVCPATLWYEREVAEECGIIPSGHPGPLHLRLPDDWPEGVYPHGGGFSWQDKIPAVAPHPVELASAPDGIVDYPLGPVRSGVVESGHYLLRTAGEELVDMRLQLFYKHRGIEKRAEGCGLLHLPLIAERISGTSAFAHSLALCEAVERAAGIEAPPRARYLRTLFAELERLYNHHGYQADLCQATGLVVGQAQFDVLKERLLRLNARLAGHRYLFGLNVPGGLSRDLTDTERRIIGEELRFQRRTFTALEELLFRSNSHIDRLERTGTLPPELALAWGAVGPVGRAVGVDRDLRRDHPYAAYAELDFAVPLETDGDALARARLRLEEVHQSFRLIDQILGSLPSSAVRVPPEACMVRAGASALGWVESPRGEGVHWLSFGEQRQARRYRVRTGSFANWQAFPAAVPGHNILTDFPVIEQSFGLSFAGADR